MGSTTKIEWTDATWNPILGCSRVSEGCRNCYAERLASRFKTGPYEGLAQIVNGQPQWTGRINKTKKLLEPLKWKPVLDYVEDGGDQGADINHYRPRRIFVNSMSDLFHENVTPAQIAKVFAVMALSDGHIFQILTKRPVQMHGLLTLKAFRLLVADWIDDLAEKIWCAMGTWSDLVRVGNNWPLPNVWLGVSAENQATADERIPLLLQTPAAKRFVSCEPLLGPVSLRWKNSTDFGTPCPRHKFPVPCADGTVITDEYDGLRELDWVICGGESGPGARPMHPDWARSLRDQCRAAGVPFFFKQWGEWWPNDQGYFRGSPESGYQCAYDEPGQEFTRLGKKSAGALLDGREWKEFPEVSRG